MVILIIVSILVCWFFWLILVVNVIMVLVIVLVFCSMWFIIIYVIVLVWEVIKLFKVNIVKFNKIIGFLFYLLDIIFMGICNVVCVRL